MFFVNQVHLINIRSEERKGLFQKKKSEIYLCRGERDKTSCHTP